jgi:hypothetical protein
MTAGMMKYLGYVTASLVCAAGCLDTVDEASVDQGLNGAPEPHLMRAKDAGNTAGTSPDMTFHGGTVLTASKTEAIFWGAWSPTSDIVTGLDTFFSGFGGSHYAADSSEYAGSNGQVTSASTYLGHVFDTTTAPKRALSTNSAVAEGCKITNNSTDPGALYLIYTSTGAGHVNYCAWHTWGTCSNGALIQVAYMPNITGITGCDPGDTVTGHSEGLAALANVTAHELSETITDARGNAWYDSSGNENGDKCAWSFPSGTQPVVLADGTGWVLQGEWSNNAFDRNTGYPNRSAQNGCLY